MRRVVVTGIGLLTPLGQGREITWKAILAGRSGAGRITTFDPEGYACQIACEVPRVDGRGGGGPDVEGSFDPEATLPAKDRRRIDDFILYAIAAADEAVADSGWKPETTEDFERTGVIIGSGIGGLSTIADTAIELHEKGPRRVSPFFIPSALINLASGQVSIRHGFKGPNHSVVTACATGAHAIGDAARMIRYGDADVMVAGGAEASICPIGIAGFIACRAMSTSFNDAPEKASRPYDKESQDLKNSVKILPVNNSGKSFNPDIPNIRNMTYPFTRVLYFVANEPYYGLGNGLIRWSCQQLGQIVVSKEGLQPYYIFQREVQMR